MFEELEVKPKRNYWSYATIGLAAVAIISFVIFLLRSYDLPSVSKLWEGRMQVDGEVFIVTQGRGNVKLGLVEVCAIPEKDMLDWIDSKETKAKFEREKAKKRLTLVEDDLKV